MHGLSGVQVLDRKVRRASGRVLRHFLRPTSENPVLSDVVIWALPARRRCGLYSAKGSGVNEHRRWFFFFECIVPLLLVRRCIASIN